MADRRLHILVAEPSLIIRRGIISVLLDIDTLGVDVTDVCDISILRDKIKECKPDFVIVSSLHLGTTLPHNLTSSCKVSRFIALDHYTNHSQPLKGYDGIISVMDSIEKIEETLTKLSCSSDTIKEDELSAREKEIVTAIALGKSNKEIADWLCISTHTVMTHRKNIASKLKIHNPAGLTIYAIVNKLIDIGDVK